MLPNGIWRRLNEEQSTKIINRPGRKTTMKKKPRTFEILSFCFYRRKIISFDGQTAKRALPPRVYTHLFCQPKTTSCAHWKIDALTNFSNEMLYPTARMAKDRTVIRKTASKGQKKITNVRHCRNTLIIPFELMINYTCKWSIFGFICNCIAWCVSCFLLLFFSSSLQ